MDERGDPRLGGASRLGPKPYAARVRGERRVQVVTKVRGSTVADIERLLAGDQSPERTRSQLLRRYILEGVTRDKARASANT
jgi:hypothetical protein